ncbi:MAG: hypothetical protein J1G02_06360 [Clostridiales bacterium]|nr:hypothetical protein [Clostridiales bacterium]
MELTIQQRQYQLDHSHVFTATVKRTKQKFKFGFVDDTTSDTQSTEHVHGFWSGRTSRTIETVETVDINAQDTIELDQFGFGKVSTTHSTFLNPLELQFVPKDMASKITKITLNATGSK